KRRNNTVAYKKGDLAVGLQQGIGDIETRLSENDLVNNTSPDHPLPFSGWWALLVWAIVLTFISARGYVKTLGVMLSVEIIHRPGRLY
ncbi:hypothetical protein ACUOFC_44105, partial [Escherichia sp. TWPC-MK]